jgi:predicted metal-binding membrane protein
MPSRAGPTRPERRFAVIATLALVTILSWAYVVRVARAPGMSAAMPMDMTPMGAAGASAATLLRLFLMWVAMMAGMMLPAVLPAVLLFMAMARQRQQARRAPLSVPAFVGGYLAIWTGFSALAALLQTRLNVALLDLAPSSRPVAVAGGALLLLTGAYQWTAFKAGCLSHCRSPVAHFTAHWREGTAGALRMGLEHGLLCLACCWLLMGLLFVGGVMNPLWVGGLALLVLLEKVLPRGDLVGRIVGAGLAMWGVVLMVRG